MWIDIIFDNIVITYIFLKMQSRNLELNLKLSLNCRIHKCSVSIVQSYQIISIRILMSPKQKCQVSVNRPCTYAHTDQASYALFKHLFKTLIYQLLIEENCQKQLNGISFWSLNCNLPALFFRKVCMCKSPYNIGYSRYDQFSNTKHDKMSNFWGII